MYTLDYFIYPFKTLPFFFLRKRKVNVCFYFFICFSVLLACTSAYRLRDWCPWRAEEAYGPQELE